MKIEIEVLEVLYRKDFSFFFRTFSNLIIEDVVDEEFWNCG
jgi:hypothetical protein